MPPSLACSRCISARKQHNRSSLLPLHFEQHTHMLGRGRGEPRQPRGRVPRRLLSCRCRECIPRRCVAVPGRRAAQHGRQAQAASKQSVGPRARGARHLHHLPRSPPRQLSAISPPLAHTLARPPASVCWRHLLLRHAASSALWLKLARTPSPAARAFAHTPHVRSSRRSRAACSPPLLFSRLANRRT